MAKYSNNFPSMGDTGEKPPDGKDWQGKEQVNEKHFDYLWDQIEKFVDNVIANALQNDGSVAIDNDTYQQWRNNADSADIDGWKVNTSDELEAGAIVKLANDLIAQNGELIWDESESHIPIAQLEASAVTITAGDGLKGGGSVGLSASTTLNIEPNDFAGTFLNDDGSDNLAVQIHDSLRDDGSGNIRVDETYGMTWTAQQQFNAGLDTRGDIVDNTTVIWDTSEGQIGNNIVDSGAIQNNAVGLGEINQGISPTWTSEHTFNGGITAESNVDIRSGSVLQLDGNTALQSVAASGQVTLSSGRAEVDTGITAIDATFTPFIGVDDPNADTKISARLFWDDSDGSYHIEFIETDTNVGNPTVNYDILRCR